MNFRKILALTLAIVMVLGTMSTVAFAAEGEADVWNGTYPEDINENGWIDISVVDDGKEDDLYIDTAEEFAAFAQIVNAWEKTTNPFTNKTVYLNVDIDLDNHEWIPIGPAQPREKNRFYGSFYGQGHTISNLNVAEGYYYAGLFGKVPTWGYTQVFDGITIDNATVASADNTTNDKEGAGALLGGSRGAVVSDCHVTGAIEISGDKFVGGLIGDSYAQISDCSVKATGTITATGEAAGGLVGQQITTAGQAASVTNCAVIGNSENELNVTSNLSKVGGAIGNVALENVTETTISGITVMNVSVEAETADEENGVAYVASGYVAENSVVANVSATLADVEVTPEDNESVSAAVAELNGKGYATLEAAVAAAAAGDTIIILDNLSELAEVVNGGNSLKGITIKLGTDFDLEGVEWTPIGNSTNKFEGYFDGADHTISNLTVTGNNRYAGFFGYIKGTSMTATATPTVQNLNIVNASVEGDYYVGALSGQGYTCAVKNVTCSGEVNGTRYVGGLIGHVYTYFEDCHFKGDVTASFDAGGGIAGAGDGRVYNSSVIGTVSGNNWMGGIIGNGQEGASAVGCYVKATVSSGTNYYYGIGGIAGVAGHGYASSEFKNNYFDGEVYLCGEKVEAIVLGIVNADSNDDIKATVSGNSWNTEYYPADTLVFVTAEVSSSSPTADEWKAAAAEELTQSRNNNLVMLESDLEYVDTINPEEVTIMSFSDVTEEAVEEATQANIVAKIGETPYASLQDAIAAAQTGDTVTLINDVVISKKHSIDGKDISLDLAGYTISGEATSQEACLFIIANDAKLTIVDSSEDESGKVALAVGSSNVGYVFDVEGALVLESGTIETSGDWSIGFCVDVRPNAWGKAYSNPTTFVMNGGKLVSSDAAVRVASSSSPIYSDVSAAFTFNGGVIEADYDGIFVQQSNAEWDVLSANINGGSIVAGTPVRIYGPTATSFVNGEDCIDIEITSGSFTSTKAANYTWLIDSLLRVSGGVTDEDVLKSTDITISGGTFTGNVSEYVADGFDLYRTANGYVVVDEDEEFVADTINVVYKDVTPDDAEGEKVYEIVVKANGEEEINDLASVDVSLVLGSNAIEGGNINFEVAPAKDFAITRYEDEHRYMFNYNGVTAWQGKANAIPVGTITVTGYGTFSIETAVADTNVVNATTVNDNLVDSYTTNGAEDKDLTTGGLVINKTIDNEYVGTVGETTIAVPVRDLAIDIAFKNAVANQKKAYQEMKVTISGGDLAENIEIELGNDAEEVLNLAGKADAAVDVDYANNAYIVNVTDALTLNRAYTVTVSGAGYRTARYTVTMTGDKKLSFWNNVMDKDTAVEEGEFETKATFLAGDIVKDNDINIYDLSAVVSYFGTDDIDTTDVSEYAKYDLNRDGVIDSKDVAYVLVSWEE